MLTVDSADDMIEIMIKLGGKKIGDSFLALKIFWPLEYSYKKCKRLNWKAKRRAGFTTNYENGCFYHTFIEKK